MQPILDFVSANGKWIFGSGGAVAVVFTLMRLFGSGKNGAAPTTQGNIRIDADRGAEVVSGTKTVRNGIDGVTLVALLVAVMCFAAFAMSFGGNTAVATGNGTAIVGDGNNTVENN